MAKYGFKEVIEGKIKTSKQTAYYVTDPNSIPHIQPAVCTDTWRNAVSSKIDPAWTRTRNDSSMVVEVEVPEGTATNVNIHNT